jgi:hypothetical protein
VLANHPLGKVELVETFSLEVMDKSGHVATRPRVASVT